MKYLLVTALHDSDAYPRSFFKGCEYRIGYGVLPGFERFGNRFYLYQEERFTEETKLICALNAKDAKYYFGVEAGDFECKEEL